MTDNAKYQQNIFDFCIEKHGELNNIVEILEDNSLQLDSEITQGLLLEYVETTGNAKNKEFYKENSITPINERQNSGIADIDYTDIVYIPVNTTDNAIYVQGGQSIFDYCIWQYGTLSQLTKLFEDNGLQFDSILQQGTEMVVDDSLKTLYITDFFKQNNVIPLNYENNADIVKVMTLNGNGFLLNGKLRLIFN